MPKVPSVHDVTVMGCQPNYHRKRPRPVGLVSRGLYDAIAIS